MPNLAIEVMSESNTMGEMARKWCEYFAAGVQLLWFVDPKTRTVAVYTAPEQFTLRHEEDTLDGGAVLPGFSLSLRELFQELDRQER
ncbi:MAG: Uma2 family endonuclease [bacterium]|nr:Uma2 family endonuclease [bacterium]